MRGKNFLFFLAILSLFLTVLFLLIITPKSLKKNLKTEKAQKEIQKKELAGLLITLDPPQKEVSLEDSFAVSVVGQTTEELMAIDLFLSYDSQVLKLEEVRPGDFFTSPMELSKSLKTPGKIFYALASLSPTQGSGAIATLVFKGKNVGVSELRLEENTIAAVKEKEKIEIQLPPPAKYFIIKE